MPKNIIKYSNRKLYDKDQSKYVTSKQVLEWVSDGIDVVITDYETDVDLTRQVLGEAVQNQALLTKEELVSIIVNKKGMSCV